MHHQATIGTKSSSKAFEKIKIELKFESDFKPELEFGFIMHCRITLNAKISFEALLEKKKTKNQNKYEA